MKVLFFHAVAAHPKVALPLMNQAGNVLRPFHRFLAQAIHTARQRSGFLQTVGAATTIDKRRHDVAHSRRHRLDPPEVGVGGVGGAFRPPVPGQNVAN